MTLRRLASVSALVLLAGLLPARAVTPVAPLQGTPLMAEETKMVISLLETVHYLNTPISDATFKKLISEFMYDLDQHRLFFTAQDHEAFVSTYGPTLGKTLRQDGNLDVAFRIFAVYRERLESRVDWIQRRLAEPIDLAVDEQYVFDRKDLPWPATAEEADDLWRKRIKFEIIPDLLNDKTLEQATDAVSKRYERLRKNFHELEAPEVQEIFLSTLTRMHDPHSTFFSASTLEDFSISMRLSLVGIGALLSSEDGTCVIRELIPGGPAILSKAVNVNDRIVAVAQPGEEPVDVIGMNLRKIVNMIRGEQGTPITLTIVPADSTDLSIRRDITLVRDVVQLNAARSKASIHEVPGVEGDIVPIGVIEIPSFYGPVDDPAPGEEPSSSVTQDVEELLGKLKAAGVHGIVLDLRRNGGGLLGEAVDLTGLFIRTGPVVMVRNSYGQIINKPDTDPKVAYDGPLMVLTSRYSASASEIVAGALQNYGRAIIVGDSSTHGKGTVQAVLEMKTFLPRQIFTVGKTGATKLTVQKFYLPNGSSTQNKGVIPDISLPAIEDFRPIGEADLPYSLPWDTVGGLRFPGRQLDPALRAHLDRTTRARLDSLEEFHYLQESIDWMREREQLTSISLDLDARRQLKERDEAFREAMKSKRSSLTSLNYANRPIVLDSVAANESTAPTLEELVEDPEPSDDVGFDIHLRESLRILRDTIALVPDPKAWTDSEATYAVLSKLPDQGVLKNN
jgi:carboxyl-terminal processing protease